MTFSEAGRKGGQALLAKIGTEGMSRMGKMGGRPRNLSYSELKERGLLRNIRVKEEELYRREFQSDKLFELVARTKDSLVSIHAPAKRATK
jgi:hypothetical protein